MTATKLSDLEVYLHEKGRLVRELYGYPGLDAVFVLTDHLVERTIADGQDVSIPELVYALRMLHTDISVVVESLVAGKLQYGDGKRANTPA